MKIHIVQKGDTLWKISKQYGVDFVQLKAHNPQLASPDMIMPGMKIKVPVPAEDQTNKAQQKAAEVAPKKAVQKEKPQKPAEMAPKKQVQHEAHEAPLAPLPVQPPSIEPKSQQKPKMNVQPQMPQQEKQKPQLHLNQESPAKEQSNKHYEQHFTLQQYGYPQQQAGPQYYQAQPVQPHMGKPHMGKPHMGKPKDKGAHPHHFVEKPQEAKLDKQQEKVEMKQPDSGIKKKQDMMQQPMQHPMHQHQGQPMIQYVPVYICPSQIQQPCHCQQYQQMPQTMPTQQEMYGVQPQMPIMQPGMGVHQQHMQNPYEQHMMNNQVNHIMDPSCEDGQRLEPPSTEPNEVRAEAEEASRFEQEVAPRFGVQVLAASGTDLNQQPLD